MARPIWSGTLSFGLLNVPVSLMSGQRAMDLHFRMLDSRNKSPVRYERINAETGDEVPWKDIVKAFEYKKGSYVVLKPEDIASQLALRQSLAPLARAYYSKGFQDARIQAPATFDRPTHHVSYNIHVVPGEQYRIHSVKTAGLSDVQVKQFNSAWHMNSGDFYDVNYLTDFLKQNSALQSLRGYSASYKAYSDPNTHLVDLVITFVKGGTLIQVD